MRPTPRKLALLMSAVGLGLSLPGAALARWDSAHQEDFASASDPTAGRVQRCHIFGDDPLARCQPANDGVMLQAGAAAARPSESTETSQRLCAVDWPHWVIDADSSDSPAWLHIPEGADAAGPVETVRLATQTQRAVEPLAPGRPGAGQPGGATQTAESVEHDRQAGAIAMVLMADPPPFYRAIAPATSAPLESTLSNLGQRASSEPVEAGDSHPERESVEADLESRLRADMLGSAEVPSAAQPRTASGTTPDVAVSLVSAAAEADTRGAGAIHDGAPERPIAVAPTAIERVLSSLGEFSQPQSGSPPRRSEMRDGQAAIAANDPPVGRNVALPAFEPALGGPALPGDGVGNTDKAQRRLSSAKEIVVASHGDKVLLSLAALRSDAEPESGRFGAQTKETVVVQHADKVLLTLASLLPERAKKRVRPAALTPADSFQDQLLSAPPDGGKPSASDSSPINDSIANELSGSLGAHHVADDSPAVPARQTLTDPVLRGLPTMREAVGHAPIDADAVALTADRLDEVRGGFVTDRGLQISFGIERAVYLNGNLVTRTNLNLADLGKISAGQAARGSADAGGLTLIQSGPGNTFLPGTISPSSVGTVIQNTLDNQKIQTITRIDAAVNAAGILRAINLQSSLRSAITDSLHR